MADVYQVEDDWFLDLVVRQVPSAVRFNWHGKRYVAEVPPQTSLPAYLLVDGVDEPPPGDLILVLRVKPRLFDLFRSRPLHQGAVQAVSDTRDEVP